MKSYRWVLLLVSVIFVLTSCNSARPSAIPAQVTPSVQSLIMATQQPDIATQQADKATVTGRAFNKKTGAPLSNQVLRMAETFRSPGKEGVFILDTSRSPRTVTDSNGYFIFENISPLEYVVLLEVMEGAYSVVKGDDGKPLTWQTEAGKKMDLGSIYVVTEIP
jgi:hypothetical protein